MTPEMHPDAIDPDTDPVSDADADGNPQGDTLQAALADMQDRWMRSEAEIANVRMRAKRDVEEARQFAVQKFASDIVETAENLRRGLDTLPPATEAEPQSVAGLRAGLSEIERAFIATLNRHGLKAVDPTGTAFVPELHQAIGEREDPSHPPGTVLQALGPVWTLNGRLLRPAMVIVAKPPPHARAAEPWTHSRAHQTRGITG